MSCHVRRPSQKLMYLIPLINRYFCNQYRHCKICTNILHLWEGETYAFRVKNNLKLCFGPIILIIFLCHQHRIHIDWYFRWCLSQFVEHLIINFIIALSNQHLISVLVMFIGLRCRTYIVETLIFTSNQISHIIVYQYHWLFLIPGS